MSDEIKVQEFGAADKVKLWTAVAAVAAGVIAYYLLSSEAAWMRWLCVLGGIVVGAAILALSRYGAEFRAFAVSARVELRKVVWPNRQETLMTTGVVFVFVAIAALFFWGLDLLLAWAVRMLTGQGG